ncbi:MAG TPA: Omp28-related outer membrane protein [Ignavibacteria bacterium]|nr:Omp28-related outer membrane protein [Ignavibacteria bacterium]
MRKLLLIPLFCALLISLNTNKSNAQSVAFNTVLEYCTGTWCQWCPCGHDIIDAIYTIYPETVVLAYHGAGSDPWQSYSAGIRSLMGMSSYPTGVVGRRTGIISRSAWINAIVTQKTVETAKAEILSTKSYNAATREITVNVTAKALENLTGDYRINFILTEDNLIYHQYSNNTCSPGTTYYPVYEHDHVVKAMINGDLGEMLNTGSVWNQDQVINKTLVYTLPTDVVPENCAVNIIIWKQEGSLTSNSVTINTGKVKVDGPTNINPIASSVTDYKLAQNYPNPFNPTTNINFTVPKDMNISLRVYDVKGTEVAVLANGFVKKGTYNTLFEGKGLSSGIYYYKLIAGDFIDTKKMVLNK